MASAKIVVGSRLEGAGRARGAREVLNALNEGNEARAAVRCDAPAPVECIEREWRKSQI